MAAPVGEVRGRSREDDPVQSLQVRHAWAGEEYHDGVPSKINRAHHPKHRCSGVWEDCKAFESDEVQFNPNIILC